MIVRRFSASATKLHRKKFLRADWKPNTLQVGPAFNRPVREIYRGLRLGGMSIQETRNNIYSIIYHTMDYPPAFKAGNE